MNAIHEALTFDLKGVSSLGEGILSLRNNQAVSQMHSGALSSHAVRWRSAAHHILSSGGDSETAGGKRKALVSKFVCVCVQWQLTAELRSKVLHDAHT